MRTQEASRGTTLLEPAGAESSGLLASAFGSPPPDEVVIGGDAGLLGVRWDAELDVRKVVVYDGDGRLVSVHTPVAEGPLRWNPRDHGLTDVLASYFVMLYSDRGVLLRRAWIF